MPQNWLTQTFLLIVIFPLLMIVLGEISLNLEKKRNLFTYTLKILSNLILPFFSLYVLLLQVIQLTKESIWVKLSETGLWITLIYFGLNLVNQILFEDAQEGSWQSNVPKLLLDLSRTFLVLVGSAIVDVDARCKEARNAHDGQLSGHTHQILASPNRSDLFEPRLKRSNPGFVSRFDIDVRLEKVPDLLGFGRSIGGSTGLFDDCPDRSLGLDI
jgi:hypothetical protein